MATTKKGLTARIAAGVGAAAIATVTILGGALPASAAPDNIQPASAEPRTLTIHKFAQPENATNLPNDGRAIDAADIEELNLRPLDGVQFTVQQVPDIDLTTNAGWQAADGMTVAEAQTAIAAAGAAAPTPAVRATENGTARFSGLADALYLVTETGFGTHSVAIPAQPFLVSLPLPVDNAWVYDVHVYPKNSLTAITKVVDDSAAFGLGSEVSWTIGIDVPEIGENALTELRITDTMDSRLQLTNASLAVTQAGATAGSRVPVDLVFGTDYAVTSGPDYEIEFTQAGLDELAALNLGRIEIEVATKVIGVGSGVIQNSATLFINGRNFTTAPVETKWGSLSILKHQTGDSTAVLGNAQFQVFTSEEAALEGETPVSVNGATTFTSDATTGVAFVAGLRHGTYWLVETEAPVGYLIDSTPLRVVVDAPAVSISVENDQVPGYALPITGGSGQAAFMIGGAGLILGGFGFVLLRRRKTPAANQA